MHDKSRGRNIANNSLLLTIYANKNFADQTSIKDTEDAGKGEAAKMKLWGRFPLVQDECDTTAAKE